MIKLFYNLFLMYEVKYNLNFELGESMIFDT